MEHSDHWEQLQRHGSLHDTYLSEDPPHIRKMFLVSCLRSLLYADTVAASELEQEEELKNNNNKTKSDNNNSNHEEEDNSKPSAESSNGNERQLVAVNSNNNNNNKTKKNLYFNPNQTFNEQMHNSTDGVNNFFMSIVGMLRRCESPECETGEAKSALRVLGPHNVVLSWIARPRLGSGGTISTVGPAQTTDDWNIAVMCDGCIQKSMAKMANVGPPVKPETSESLALERRRSAFLLVDVTSWPSWAGSVQYAPWLNIRWGRGNGGASPTAKSHSTAASSAPTTGRHSDFTNNSSTTHNESGLVPSNSNNNISEAVQELHQQQQVLHSTFGPSGATIEEAFISAIRSSFEAGLAQGLFLLPGNRESITMNLENLIFFGYGCAHRDEPDIIRTALRNPSIYPVLFHKLLPSLRGLELWRNRSQTPAQVEAALKLKKEQEKRRKKMIEEQKKKKEKALKEQKEREKKGLPPVNANNSSNTEIVSNTNNNVNTSNYGKPLEWIHAIEHNLLPLRHPALCHFSTHCESLQPTTGGNSAVAASSSAQSSIVNISSSSPGGGDNNNNGDDQHQQANNARGDEDGNDHGASFSLLVDAEERRFKRQASPLPTGINNNNNNHLLGAVASSSSGTSSTIQIPGIYDSPLPSISSFAAQTPQNNKNNSTSGNNNNPPYATSAAFISIHCFIGGDVSLDSISAWHIIPPKFKVNSAVLELNRNDSNDAGFVPRMIQSMQFQLVGLHLVDCTFSTWTDFFTDFLVLLPKLQTLKMMCCRCGLEDAVQEHTSTSILNYYSAAATHSRMHSSTNNNNNHSRSSSTVFMRSNSNNNTHHRSSSMTPTSSAGAGGGPHHHHSRTMSSSFGGGAANASLQKHIGSLKDLRHVELRSVPIDSKVIGKFFDLAPGISSFVFPPNAIRRQQMQQNGFSIDPQAVNLLTERMFLQLMNNGTELKQLEILAECPGELFALNYYESPLMANNNNNNQGSNSNGASAKSTPRGGGAEQSNPTMSGNLLNSSQNHNLMNVIMNQQQQQPSSPTTANNNNQQLSQQEQLLRHQKHSFTLDFWSRFKCLQKLHCQGWLSRSMLHAVAHLPNIEFIDGASSLDLTRADLFEACLIPAFRKEGRLFLSLRYLDVSFCHRLYAAGKTLNDPVDENAERGADERIATLIRQTFPDRSSARRMAVHQQTKKRLMQRALDEGPLTLGGSSTLMDQAEINELYGSPSPARGDGDTNNNEDVDQEAEEGEQDFPTHGSVHSSEEDEEEDEQESAEGGEGSKSSKRKKKEKNDQEDDEDVFFQPPPDPYPNAPKLKVLCQRGFRNVPRSLLNLEVELLTSCRNEEEDGHKVDVIDMRAIKMTDEERELVTYQFESCGLNYLLADTPVVEMADVIVPGAPTPKAIPNINFLTAVAGQTPSSANSGRFQTGVTPRSSGAAAGKPTPRSSAALFGGGGSSSISVTPSKPSRYSSSAADDENQNDNNDEGDEENNEVNNDSDESGKGDKKKCVIQ